MWYWVTSLIAVTSKPADCNARIADSRPGPGPLTVTSTVLNRVPLQILMQFLEAICAAKGVDF